MEKGDPDHLKQTVACKKVHYNCSNGDRGGRQQGADPPRGPPWGTTVTLI